MIRCTSNVRAVESGRKSKILIFWQKWSGRQQRSFLLGGGDETYSFFSYSLFHNLSFPGRFTLSFEGHRQYYTQKIGENPDWEFAGIFADRGITGTSMKKRAEFNRMIAACKRGRIDLIRTACSIICPFPVGLHYPLKVTVTALSAEMVIY